jgi:hypothetical protein
LRGLRAIFIKGFAGFAHVNDAGAHGLSPCGESTRAGANGIPVDSDFIRIRAKDGDVQISSFLKERIKLRFTFVLFNEGSEENIIRVLNRLLS